MKTKIKRRRLVHEVLETQLKTNDPPEANATLERLRNMGFTDAKARKLIWNCLVLEVCDSLQNNKHFFNEKRYIHNLSNLPNSPVE